MYRLAHMLGMPVFQLMAILPRSEYVRWLSYLKYEEADVQEIQLATLSMLVANALGGKSKVKDFLIHKPNTTPQAITNRDGSPKVMSEDAIRNVFSGVAIPSK